MDDFTISGFGEISEDLKKAIDYYPNKAEETLEKEGRKFKKLAKENTSNAKLILDSHANMDKYVSGKVSAVIFNLGYLPGGDHSVCTKGDTSISAIEKALALISCEGFVSVTVYYGKNSGTEEKDAVMEYFKSLDHKKYTVLVHDFYNRPNNPPITVIITKNN